MAITVGINSYVTEAELTTYALDRGITITGDLSILLIKAMDYIETRPFIGEKTDSTQALQFPRDPDTTVPNDIKKAQSIASILIGQGYDLQSTLGQTVKREKVASLETEYADYSTGAETFRALDDVLRQYVESSTSLKVIRT